MKLGQPGPPPPRDVLRQEGAGVSSESRQRGGKEGIWVRLGAACSWLRQGPYLSFSQVIGDEPDEDGRRAHVG